MPINTKEIEFGKREDRLGTITGYQGTLNDLVVKSQCGALGDRRRCFSQANSCSSECAHNYLAGIVDAVIINHAPIGCSSDSILYNAQYNTEQKIMGWQHTNIGFFSTNMTKEDTVFGATGKLQDTIREVYALYKPNAIFITTSCVSGIIGEDIKGALDELKEEVPIPLAPVFCEGFKSKTWSSGWDAAFHAILTSIVKPPRFKTNKVNMINFHGGSRAQMAEILARLNLEAVFMVPTGTIENLSRMSEAAATITVCETLGTYVGNALEQQYGVPFIKCLNPHGIAGIENCLRELGKVTEKEIEVEAYLQEEKEKYEPEFLEIKQKLDGVKVAVGMGAGFALDYTRVLKELGTDVVWVSAWHFDQTLDDGTCPKAYTSLAASDANLPISVNDMQNYELVNILQKVQPDIYISRHRGTGVFAAKLGIAAIIENEQDSLFGYEGTTRFGYQLLDLLTNRNWERNLAQRLKLPYTNWWLKQDNCSLYEEEAE
jgi:Nitrogenase molybdenum-iron protein, alpha and beta chains